MKILSITQWPCLHTLPYDQSRHKHYMSNNERKLTYSAMRGLLAMYCSMLAVFFMRNDSVFKDGLSTR